MKSLAQVIVLAGGLGTRLRAVEPGKPKPMAQVVDRPFLEFQLEALREQGLTDVILAVGHLAEQIEAHFGSGRRYGLQIKYAVERELLGTAGAIRNAATLLHGSLPFLVLNGDTLMPELDYAVVLRGHRDAVATLVTVPPPDNGAYGVLDLDSSGERILGFREKAPIVAGDAVISGGAYVLDLSVLDFIATRQTVSIEVDVFPKLLTAGRVIRAHRYQGFFGDMGTPEGLARMAQHVAARRCA